MMAEGWGARLRELEAERQRLRARVAACPHPEALCVCRFELEMQADAVRLEVKRVTAEQLALMRELGNRGREKPQPE
jgi:hypothetical protein